MGAGKKCVFLLSFIEAHEMAIKVYEWDKNRALFPLPALFHLIIFEL